MILLRHGQSEFNLVYSETRIDPGIEDPHLTPDGEQQAAEAGVRLGQHDVRRIVTSPYRRTLKTAQIVADALGLPVSVEPLVREHAAFTCDIGTPASELRRHWPTFDFGAVPEVWWPHEDESEADVLERCARFRQAATGMVDWSHLLVVTHWGFIRGLTGQELANDAMLRFDPLNNEATAVVGRAPAC